MKANLKALMGGVAALAFTLRAVPHFGHEAWAHALLVFAALVLAPLALELFSCSDDPAQVRKIFAGAKILQLPAGLLLAAACWLHAGSLAATLTVPWVVLTAALAAAGVLRLRHGGIGRSLDGMCADAALIFVVVGGLWALADRAGLRPLSFDPGIVTLTAVHFHYAGFLLPLFAGLVQREVWFSRFASRAAVGVVLGVPAVAVGITTTRLGWDPAIETAAGCGLALAGASVAILQVRLALEAKWPVRARVLVGISGASLFFGMVLAALYALRPYAAPLPWLGVPHMRMLHGTVNAFGFGLCGLLGWSGVQQSSRDDKPRN